MAKIILISNDLNENLISAINALDSSTLASNLIEETKLSTVNTHFSWIRTHPTHSERESCSKSAQDHAISLMILWD